MKLLLLPIIAVNALAVYYTIKYAVRILKVNGYELPSLSNLAKGASYSIHR